MEMGVLVEDVMDGSLVELLYVDDLTLCGESLNEVINKYGGWKNAVEGKGLRVNVNKTKDMQLLFGKKSSASRVSEVSRLVVILFNVRNARVGFIVIALMCLGRCVYYHVGMSFVCRTCLGHNCSVEGKSGFKKSENVLEEVKKFCYLVD